jgi:hypothetical protein
MIIFDVDPILPNMSPCFTLLSEDCLIGLVRTETQLVFGGEIIVVDKVAAISSLLF